MFEKSEKSFQIWKQDFFENIFLKIEERFFGADLRTQNLYRYKHERLKKFYTRVTGIKKLHGLWM